MYRYPYPSDYSLAIRELLFVGFSPDFESNIQNFPYTNPDYKYIIENNPFKAYHWLQERVENLETFQPPFAIFCHLNWLEKNDFYLARQIAAHPDLCYVPFIVLAEKPQHIDQAQVSAFTIDDCYTVPVDWMKVEERLLFLHQYKPRMLEQTKRVLKEDYRLKIPRLKRIFDIIGASLAILLTCWIWIPVAIAIRLESRGPVIYRSRRAGFGYQVFDFFKFRSMYLHADLQVRQMRYMSKYDTANGQEAVFIKIHHDPRITRVGRFIRRYSIDELPQLFNVLRGDMSLVGNRPLPLYEAELLTRDEWIARFLAPAGITGLWQITKSNAPAMTTEERIALDLQYSRVRYSVMNDLRIALKTFSAFVQKEEI